jgi:hypothetical protein
VACRSGAVNYLATAPAHRDHVAQRSIVQPSLPPRRIESHGVVDIPLEPRRVVAISIEPCRVVAISIEPCRVVAIPLEPRRVVDIPLEPRSAVNRSAATNHRTAAKRPQCSAQ